MLRSVCVTQSQRIDILQIYSARTIERICIMAKTNNDNIEVDLQILGKSFRFSSISTLKTFYSRMLAGLRVRGAATVLPRLRPAPGCRGRAALPAEQPQGRLQTPGVPASEHSGWALELTRAM